jgi:hypothetical protein
MGHFKKGKFTYANGLQTLNNKITRGFRHVGGIAGAEDFVFVYAIDRPLSQEWLNKRVWKQAFRRAGIRERGQYCIPDTFFTLSLSAGMA